MQHDKGFQIHLRSQWDVTVLWRFNDFVTKVFKQILWNWERINTIGGHFQLLSLSVSRVRGSVDTEVVEVSSFNFIKCFNLLKQWSAIYNAVLPNYFGCPNTSLRLKAEFIIAKHWNEFLVMGEHMKFLEPLYLMVGFLLREF